MPQVPAAATANPASRLPKSVMEGPGLLVDAHRRRHREALSLGVLREGIPVPGWIAFASCLLGKKTRRGLQKGAVVAPSSKEVTGHQSGPQGRCHMCRGTFRNGPSKPPWDILPS